MPLFLKRFTTAAVVMLTVAPIAFAADPPPVVRNVRTILLVRHGHYVPDKVDSPLGRGLSPVGIAQAYLVAARLRGMGRFDALLASPMTRAHETARVIDENLDSVKVEIVPDLAECTPRTRRKEIIAKEKPEAIAACEAKLDAIFKKLFVPATGAERRDILVCHGNVTRYLVTRALGVDTQAWLEMSVAHASITQIRIESDGGLKVSSVGDIGHIPPNLQTGSSGMTDKELVAPK